MNVTYHIPSTWSRLGAHFLDILWCPFVALFFLDHRINYYISEKFFPLRSLAFTLLTLTLVKILCLKFVGATPGKWLMGLRVVPFRPGKGRELSWMSAITRVLTGAMLLPLFGNAPIVILFFRYDRTHLLDWLAETRVIGLVERPDRVRLRPLLGCILFIYFLFNGLSRAQDLLRKVDWQRGVIYFEMF